MALTTLSKIEEYLGVTLDSAESVLYQDIIDSVSNYIESYCDQQFSDAIYAEQIKIIDGTFHLKNNLQHFYVISVDAEDALLVDLTPSSMSNISISSSGTLTLLDTFDATDISIASKTSTQTINSINAESGWNVSLASGVTTFRSQQLVPGFYSLNESDEIYLPAYLTKIKASRVSNKLFAASVECANGVAIYQGGYATIPADLEDAATRIVIKAYADRNSSTSTTGELTSIKVGDWQESYGNINNNQIRNIAIDYYSVLDSYRNYSI